MNRVDYWSSKCGKIRYNRRMLSYWKIIKLIVGSGKCRKNRYNRSIAAHWKCIGLVIESSKQGKKSLQS